MRQSPIPQLGQNLRRVREAREMSRRQLGNAVGVSWVIIHHYEYGRSEPDAKRLYMLAHHLDVPIDLLYRGVERPLPEPVFQPPGYMTVPDGLGVFGARDGVR